MVAVLPNELWLAILSYIDAPTLRLVASTCRMFHDLVATTELQLNIELAFASLRPEPTHRQFANAAETLAMVRATQSGWLRMHSAFRTRIDIPFKAGSLYELSGGYFFCSLHSGDNQRATELAYVKLPDTPNAVPQPWQHISVQEFISDFAVDVEQDLLVFVEVLPRHRSSWEGGDGFCIHFRRLSDGAVHPAAKEPIVSFALEKDGEPIPFRYSSVVIQITGTHVAILFRCFLGHRLGADSIGIWDFRTGVRKGAIGNIIVDDTWLKMSTFVVLAADRLLVHRISPKHLEVHVFDTRPDVTEETLRPMYCHAVFELHKSMHAESSIFRSEPSNFSPPPGSRPSKPYSADPQHAIISFSLPWTRSRTQLFPDLGDEPPKNFIGTRAMFMRYMTQDTKARGPGISPLHVTWDRWSEELLWKVPGVPPSWITHTYGTRHVVQVSANPEAVALQPDEPAHIQLLDFSPVLVRDLLHRWHEGLPMGVPLEEKHFGVRESTQQRPKEKERRPRWWKRSSKLATSPAGEDGPADKEDSSPNLSDSNDPFDARLIYLRGEAGRSPCLPCLSVRSYKTHKFNGIMLDEDRIIGLLADTDVTGIAALDVFLMMKP